MLRYCTRCVMPDSKPDLQFDEEGVCSACRAYERLCLSCVRPGSAQSYGKHYCSAEDSHTIDPDRVGAPAGRPLGRQGDT